MDGEVCRGCGARATDTSHVIEENIVSALCYVLLGVTGVLFLYLEPYASNRRVRFHAFQSIFLNLVIIFFWLAISWGARSMALLISPMFLLACLILWLFLIWKAWQNQRVVLPVIGPMAEKQA